MARKPLSLDTSKSCIRALKVLRAADYGGLDPLNSRDVANVVSSAWAIPTTVNSAAAALGKLKGVGLIKELRVYDTIPSIIDPDGVAKFNYSRYWSLTNAGRIEARRFLKAAA